MKYTVEINFAFKKPLCIMQFSSFICLYLSLCPLSPLIFIQPMNPSINLYLSYYRGLSIAPWCNAPFETTCHAEGVDVAYCSFYQYFDDVPPIYQVSVNSKYCHVHTNNPVQGLVTDDSRDNFFFHHEKQLQWQRSSQDSCVFPLPGYFGQRCVLPIILKCISS